MTQSRTKPKVDGVDKSEGKEDKGVTMTTEITETPEVSVSFPQTIGDITFQTPEELAEYAAKLDKQLKEMKPIVKATKPGRPASQKKQVSEAVAKFLNSEMDDELQAAIANVEDNFVLRLNLSNGTFSLPVSAPRAEGSGGNRGGRAISVDEKDYPSAKNARDTLHPDMKDKSQNYAAIVKYLEAQGHTVVATS